MASATTTGQLVLVSLRSSNRRSHRLTLDHNPGNQPSPNTACRPCIPQVKAYTHYQHPVYMTYTNTPSPLRLSLSTPKYAPPTSTTSPPQPQTPTPLFTSHHHLPPPQNHHKTHQPYSPHSATAPRSKTTHKTCSRGPARAGTPACSPAQPGSPRLYPGRDRSHAVYLGLGP